MKSQSMKCPKCGRTFPDYVPNCPHCCIEFGNRKRKIYAQIPKKDSIIWGIIGFIVGICVINFSGSYELDYVSNKFWGFLVRSILLVVSIITVYWIGHILNKSPKE